MTVMDYLPQALGGTGHEHKLKREQETKLSSQDLFISKRLFSKGTSQRTAERTSPPRSETLYEQ